MAAASLMWAATAFSQSNAGDYEAGRIYVRLKPNINAKTGEIIPAPLNFEKNELPFANKLSEKFRVKNMGRAFRDLANTKLNATTILEFESTQLTDELIATLKKDPNVELAERIPVMKTYLTVNDPSFNAQWFLTKINAQGAWDYFSTGSNVVIAIVDDAIERNHPDLSPNIWINPGEIFGNGIDDEGNGYVDDYNGWNVGENNSNVDPPSAAFSHGTHCAGIASARSNNGVGIASIGFSCKLMCVRGGGPNPGSVYNAYAGILYAANNGAQIISCSWGGNGSSSTGQEIVDYAIAKGCIVVAAAGNDNNNEKHYPAAYNGVVSVAATDVNDVKSSFSSYGDWVKISAPGSAIYSTVPFGGYANQQGTSMATPLVAGLLGLMKSLNPGMPNTDLVNCLYNTADNILSQNPLYPGQLGAGRINAAAAMACVATSLSKPPVAIFTGGPRTITQGGKVSFTDLSIYNPTSWQWSFPGGTPSSFSGKTPPQITYGTAGTYNVSLTVSSAFGSDDTTITNMIVVNEPPSCVSINYPATGTVLDFLAPPLGANGFQNGVNANGEKQKAVYFDVSGASTNLTGITSIYVRFAQINAINPNKKVYFRVFDGTSGTPGAQLGVFERTKGQLRANAQANQYTIIDLPKNIDLPASKKFFISVDISELVWNAETKDSLSIRASLGASTSSPVWQQTSSGEWQAYGSPGAWPSAASYLLIHPFLTSKPAKSIISPTNPVVCQGTVTEFDATGSQYTSEIKWWVPGALPPNEVTGQLKITPQYPGPGVYKVFLSTIGGCGEIRVDSTVYTINAAPNLTVVAGKNPICLGETTSLTASGATTYTWSPATGLSTTTGSTVQANPASSTTYAITGSNGTCSTTLNFNLEVRASTISATLTPSILNITQPTSVVFTLAGENGGQNPNYNFLVNGSSVQNGPSNVMTRTVSPGDKVKCEFTSSEPCVVEKTIVSNEIIMGEGTLPVTLVSLTGRRVTEGNRLEWVTASEFNSDRFMIERSADGAQFERIGQVSANGFSNNIAAYHFVDTKPNAGNNYYRLKMTDRDASFRYSNVVLLGNATGLITNKLYPNPTSSGNSVIMQLGGIGRGAVSVSITGINGQVVKTFRATSTDGTLQLNIPATGMHSGNYLVICRDSNGNIIETLRWQVVK